jgi:hypothetical protein
MSERKVESFKESCYICWQDIGTYFLNMAISKEKFCFCQNLMTLGLFLFLNKIPVYASNWLLFCGQVTKICPPPPPTKQKKKPKQNRFTTVQECLADVITSL